MAATLDAEPLLVRVHRRLALAATQNSDGGTGIPGLPRPRSAHSKVSPSDWRQQRLRGPSGGSAEGTGRVDGGRKKGKENGWIPQPSRVQVQSIMSDESSEDELPSFCVQGSRTPNQGTQFWRGHIESGSGANKTVRTPGTTSKEQEITDYMDIWEELLQHERQQHQQHPYGCNELDLAAGHGKVSPAAVGSKEPNLAGPCPPPPGGCFDSSDDDDLFEAFLLKMRTPLKSKTSLKSVSRVVISSDSDCYEDFMPAKTKHVRSKGMAPSPPVALHQPVLGSKRVTDKTANSNAEPRVSPLLAGDCSLSVGSSTTNSVTLARPQRVSQILSTVSAPSPSPTQAFRTCLGSLDEFDDEFESIFDRVLKSNSKNPRIKKDTVSMPSMTKQGLPSVPLLEREPREAPAQSVNPQLPATLKKPPSFLRANGVKSCSDLELSESLAHIPSQSHASWSMSRCTVPGCFLTELSSPSSHYARNFKQCKAELTASLYKFYNETIFKKKLPVNMELLWNNKMRKTAGYCVMGKEPGPAGQPYTRIELSVKVCDTPERLRDTLVHEMCHAATWLINGQRDGHGRLWQLYARTATLVHPELPAVSRCHTYNISFKYYYECTRCKNSIGRHSKSLDTERFVCALCQGRFVLLPPKHPDGTPIASRALTPFALFVKEQYGPTRSAQPGSSHADLMRILGEKFSQTKM